MASRSRSTKLGPLTTSAEAVELADMVIDVEEVDMDAVDTEEDVDMVEYAVVVYMEV